MSYNERIVDNIINKGNSYGSDMEIIDDNEIHEVILFRGCTSRFRENELIDNVSECLSKKGIEFSTLSDESCCGIMLYIINENKLADKVVKSNIEKFNSHGVKEIITICPGCYESFRDYYSNHPDFNIKINFAMDLFEDEIIDGSGHIIHDPCHALERNKQVRSIIKNVPEKRANSCCGFGAGITKGNKELGLKMAKQTLSGDKVITYCPSCYHNLNKVDSEKTVDFFKLVKEQL
ncbi:MAG: (Fe-S)-binding protein [Methanosphaera stadtmanae]|nr:(Fe-S)-binding protein [Methanosphaera stadtmanae]